VSPGAAVLGAVILLISGEARALDPGRAPSVAWSVPIECPARVARLGPTVAGDRVLAGCGPSLSALSTGSGEVLWTRSYFVAEGGAPRTLCSHPALVDDLVLIVDLGTNLLALGLADGSQRWTHDPVADATRRCLAACAGEDEEECAETCGETYNLDWSPWQRPGMLCSTPVSVGGLAFYGAQLTGSRAVDLQTGALRWVHHLDPAASGSPAAGGGTVTASSEVAVVGLDQQTGEVRWSAEVPSALAAAGHHAVFLLHDDQLSAREPSSGELLWTTSTGGRADLEAGWRRGLTTTAERLYVVDSAGDLVAVSASTGAELWRHQGSREHPDGSDGLWRVACGTPAMSDGLVLAVVESRSERAGRWERDLALLALDATTGAERWQVPVGAGLTAVDEDAPLEPSPCPGLALAEGTAFVLDTSGLLQALR